jgi:hypothetical protein
MNPVNDTGRRNADTRAMVNFIDGNINPNNEYRNSNLNRAIGALAFAAA